MKIKSIKIKNIKSFKEETLVEFGSKLNLIIGPNGSGKSNLLDTITIVLRYFFFPSITLGIRNEMFEERDINIPQSVFTSIDKYLEPFIGCGEESHIELKLIIGKNDINNIKAIKKYKDDYQLLINSFYNKPEDLKGTNSLNFVDNWDLSKLRTNKVIKYEIHQNKLTNVTSGDGTTEGIFLSYLKTFDLFFRLADEVGNLGMRPSYIYFSPYRNTERQGSLQLNPSEDLYELLANYLNSTSRTASSLTRIAGLYFARKLRRYESEARDVGYAKKWKSDKENVEVRSYLKKIGYSWDLRFKGYNKGTYEFYFNKEQKEFLLGQASSGEKEIFNFLFGILAFIKNDGLYLIDEPELHLHPNWQNLLIRLLSDLSESTNSQFIVSTHSSLFVTEKTLPNVIRFYKNPDNSTNLIRIPEKKIKSSKELLHIINSQNNEKMFFADKVVLVEGITDRLIIKKLIDNYSRLGLKNEVVEVLDVGTKDYLQKYRKFLELIKVKNFILADKDYLKQVGGGNINKLYLSDVGKIKKDVLKNKTSKDLNYLIKVLDEVEKSKDPKDLIIFWKRIKKRKSSIKKSLSVSEEKRISDFIKLKTNENTFILSEGEIEDYFPIGNHNLNLVIEFVKDVNFKKWLRKSKDQKTKEVIEIIKRIIKD